MDLMLAAAAPPFLAEVVALIATGAVIAYVGNRFGVMPIVSFLLTGAVLGPHALGVVQDEALIESAAELERLNDVARSLDKVAPIARSARLVSRLNSRLWNSGHVESLTATRSCSGQM